MKKNLPQRFRDYMDRKGIPELYNAASKFIDENQKPFYEWISDNSKDFVQGQICESIVWYEEKDRWYLVEEFPNPENEPYTSWLAKPLRGDRLPNPRNAVIHYFNLEQDEFFLAVNSKRRPVLLLQAYDNDWLNRPGEHISKKTWLCLPIFTYKDDKHNQQYVLNDQSLGTQSRFYMPMYNGSSIPGMTKEGCIRIEALQMIQEQSIAPVKLMCTVYEPKMRRKFKVSDFGLSIIIKHLLLNLHLSIGTDYNDAYYEYFKEYCTDAIKEAN